MGLMDEIRAAKKAKIAQPESIDISRMLADAKKFGAQTMVPQVQQYGNALTGLQSPTAISPQSNSAPVGSIIRPNASQTYGNDPVDMNAHSASNMSDYLDNYNRPGMQSMAFNNDGSFKSMDIAEGTQPSVPQYKGQYAYDRPDIVSVTPQEAASIQQDNARSWHADPQKLAKGTPFVKGPGTSTSDSIPAKLSKGEAVLPAATVKHFGKAFIKKMIDTTPKVKGAKTEIKDGKLKAAAGYVPGQKIPSVKVEDDPRLNEVLQQAKANIQPQATKNLNYLPDSDATAIVGGDKTGEVKAAIGDYAGAVKNKLAEYDGMPVVPAIGKFMSDAGATLKQGEQDFANRLGSVNKAYDNIMYGEGAPTTIDRINAGATSPKPVVDPSNQVAKLNNTEQAQQPASIQQPVAAGTIPDTQIPYANAAGKKYIDNADGTKTTITGSNQLSNNIVAGMPVTNASEQIQANGDRNYVIPGDNGNATQLKIAQTGTDANGNGQFAVQDSSGSGTMSASPELMKNYAANKGKFSVGKLNPVSAQPEQATPQQGYQPQQVMAPQSTDYSEAIQSYMDQLNKPTPTGSFDRMIADKRNKQKAEIGLNALLKLQGLSQAQSSDNNKLAADQNMFNQRMAQAKTKDERDAIQQEFNNQLEAGKTAYSMNREARADKDAQNKASIEERKLANDEVKYTPPSKTTDINGNTIMTPASSFNIRTGEFKVVDNGTGNAPEIRYDNKGNAFTKDKNGNVIPYVGGK